MNCSVQMKETQIQEVAAKRRKDIQCMQTTGGLSPHSPILYVCVGLEALRALASFAASVCSTASVCRSTDFLLMQISSY